MGCFPPKQSMSMAATLRRTFRYPDDDQDRDNNVRQELDEEEQDNIIQELNMKNDAQNAFYYKVFSIVPLVGTIAYIPAIFSFSVTVGTKLIYITCILSLCMTAYLMRSGPLHSKDTRGREPGLLAVQKGEYETLAVAVEGYLAHINSFICAILFLQSWYMLSSQEYSDHSGPILRVLPGVVFGVIFIASRTLVEVDIGELEKLRYEYKGA